MHAHPADETGEDWRVVPDDSRDVEILETLQHVFHNVTCPGACHVRVVLFDDPAPIAHMLPRDHVVQIFSVEEMTPENACEAAIDLILGQPNFNGTNCIPKLVV